MNDAPLPASRTLAEYVVPPGMALSVFDNKYSRRKPDGTMQTWAERVREVVAGNFLMDPRLSIERHPDEYFVSIADISAAFRAELARTTDLAVAGIMPFSGRHLQHGDNTQPERLLELFSNCSTTLFSFQLFRLLLRGSGVGRDYSAACCRVDWDAMPNIRLVLDSAHKDFTPESFGGFLEPLREARHKYDSESETTRWFQVADSREGWSKVVEILETAAWQRKHADKLFVFDFSAVRPQGSPIAGLQGRAASGPVPLMNALARIATLKGAGMKPWKQAMFVDHELAACVVWGGARRAARMATKSWRDRDVLEFIDIKRGDRSRDGGFLWSANNSILVDAEFWEQAKRPQHTYARRVFEAAVNAAYWDKTGEPGFINVDQLHSDETGVDAITGRTCIDPQVYGDLHPRTMDMIDNVLSHVKKLPYHYITNPCFGAGTLIVTDKGAELIEDLVGREVNVWDGERWRTVDNFRITGRNQRMVALRLSNGTELRVTPYHEMILADGSRVKAWNLPLGSSLKTHSEGGCSGGRVTVDRVSMLSGFDDVVYCCTVPGSHAVSLGIGIVTGQCGEIVLSLHGGLCIIGDINLSRVENLDDAIDAAKLMSRFLVRCNLMRSEYAAEVRRTNRIGVSLTGIFEFAWNVFGLTFHDLVDYYDWACLTEEEAEQAKGNDEWFRLRSKAHAFWLFVKRMSDVAVQSAAEFSKICGLPTPHTVTTIKPSGTISKVMGCTEGAHLPAMSYYLRWTMYLKTDPDLPLLEGRGYPMKDVSDRYAGHVVVGFPTRLAIADTMGDALVTADEVSVEDNYRWVQLLERFWIGAPEGGNQVSYTLKYDASKTSFAEFAEAVLEWQPKVRCCAVMPQDDWRESEKVYGYVPEQPITKDDYEALMVGIKPVERERYDDSALQCEGGACPIEPDMRRVDSAA